MFSQKALDVFFVKKKTQGIDFPILIFCIFAIATVRGGEYNSFKYSHKEHTSLLKKKTCISQ
jgi:hypothetical protein